MTTETGPVSSATPHPPISVAMPVASTQALPEVPDLRSNSLYLNRELSWLEFNARVLAEAESESVPLLERLKFYAIVSSNLDEFFMVRVAGLKQQLSGEVGEIAPDGMTVAEQLSTIAVRVHDLVHQHTVGLVNHLLPRLAEQGIMLLKPEALPPEALA